MGIQKRHSGLEGEQTIKEGSVALERLAKILGGDVVALAPLIFQRGSLGGKLLGDALNNVGNEAVGLLDRMPGARRRRRPGPGSSECGRRATRRRERAGLHP